MKSIFNSISLFFLLSPNLLSAGQIGLGAFTSAASTQDFEILGTIGAAYTSPLLIGADTFDGDDHLLRSSGKFGPVIGRNGTALTNSPGSSSASIGFIEIVLGHPALRSGLFVGAEFAWTLNVEFYDTQNDLIGMLSFSGDGEDNAFAAWQADSGFIGRIRVSDALSGGNSPIIIDDLEQEIPEPEAISLILIALSVQIGIRHRSPNSGILTTSLNT